MTRQWALILFAMFLVVLVIDQDPAQHGGAVHPLGIVVAVAIVVLLVFAF